VQVRLYNQTVVFIKEYRKILNKDPDKFPVKNPSMTALVNALVKNRIRTIVPESEIEKFDEHVFKT